MRLRFCWSTKTLQVASEQTRTDDAVSNRNILVLKFRLWRRTFRLALSKMTFWLSAKEKPVSSIRSSAPLLLPQNRSKEHGTGTNFRLLSPTFIIDQNYTCPLEPRLLQLIDTISENSLPLVVSTFTEVITGKIKFTLFNRSSSSTLISGGLAFGIYSKILKF